MLRPASCLAFGLLAIASLPLGCDGDTETGDPNNVTEVSCEATFAILQKDAYKETAGRTSPLWPPHTTNTLTITCDGEVVREAVAANHGTQPGAKDANGDVILVEMKSVELEGSRGELEALADAFDACSCDAETTFLSLDSLSDTVVEDLVEEVAGYLLENLTCAGPSTQEVVSKLTTGDIDGFLVGLEVCAWTDGATFEDGLDEALAAIIAATSETLADYHVCNNDAVLQAGLIDGFSASGEVYACDATSAACKGPLWFYEP